MEMTLACKDIGVECSYVARGETKDTLMADAGKHAKGVHGYTDEQLSDPDMMKAVDKAIKTMK